MIKMNKRKYDVYCGVCESEFNVSINSEGVKYETPNYCPVCGEQEGLLLYNLKNLENNKKIK